MTTFTTTERRTFLAAHEIGAVTVINYRRVGQGEPSTNQRLSMTKAEAETFTAMQALGLTESKDIVAGLIITYRITSD